MAVMMAGRWSPSHNPNPVYYSNHSNTAGQFAPPGQRVRPLNPRSNYYLIVCYVCQEMAKPNQEHTLHYGGIVCFSCRAFFRRAHQKTKTPSFVCKRGDSCEVTVANRRRCQKCRYLRCLMAGMDPEAVLTDDQKVIRFRKTILKRRQDAGDDVEDDVDDAAADDVGEDDEQVASNDRLSPTFDLSNPASNLNEPQAVVDVVDDVDDDSILKSPKIPKLEEILESITGDVTQPSTPTTTTNDVTNVNPLVVKNEEPTIDFDETLFDSPSSQSKNADLDDVIVELLTSSSQTASTVTPKTSHVKMDQILRAYRMAVMQLKSPTSDLLVKKVTAIQCGDTSVSISKKEFLSMVVRQSELFRHFALQHRRFGRLNKTDQRILVARNTPLYIQQGLGAYFGARSVKDQLKLLKSYKHLTSNIQDNAGDPCEFAAEKEDLEQCSRTGGFVDLKRYNALTRMFKPGTDINHYMELTNQMTQFSHPSCFEASAVTAYALLFDFDDATKLVDPETVRECQEQAEMLVRSNTSADFANLKKTLKQMAVFCACNISWEGHEGDNNLDVFSPDAEDYNYTFPGFNLVMSYTEEEELWLNQQFKHIDEAFRSVPIGDEMLKEFFMYSLGVPLSRKYMKSVVSITLERIWRVFNIHPEFKELPCQVQRELMAVNGPLGLAVMISRYESISGIAQIREGIGELDEDRWREIYLTTFQSVDKVKKMKMKDIVAEMSVKLSPDQMSEYNKANNNLTPLVSDPVLYKLIMLLVLTKPDNSRPYLSRIQSTYMMVARRRADWMYNMDRSSKNLDTKMMIDKVALCVENLEELSKIMMFVLNKQ